MQLPIRRATLTDKIQAEKGIAEYIKNTTGDVDYNDIAKLQIHFGILERFELQNKVDCLEVESHIIRLGSLVDRKYILRYLTSHLLR